MMIIPTQKYNETILFFFAFIDSKKTVKVAKGNRKNQLSCDAL